MIHRDDLVLTHDARTTPTCTSSDDRARANPPAPPPGCWPEPRRRPRTRPCWPPPLPCARKLGAILAANTIDMEAGKAKGLTPALLDRLLLDDKRIEAMAKGVEDVAALADPVGGELARWQRPNGLDIARIRVPFGVIGIIYESRPNVTADAGGLCLKSGNAAILRGGSESINSSRAILACLQKGLAAAGLPQTCIQMLPTTDRAAVGIMLRMSDYIDVIVPRGGRSLIERVHRESRIPLLQHLEGICHIYVDGGADLEMARKIVLNAKMRRTGICGATETLLVDRKRRRDPSGCRWCKICWRPAAKCAATQLPRPSIPASCRPATRIGAPNISTPSSR